jgi:hypothetical protein
MGRRKARRSQPQQYKVYTGRSHNVIDCCQSGSQLQNKRIRARALVKYCCLLYFWRFRLVLYFTGLGLGHLAPYLLLFSKIENSQRYYKRVIEL